jgi:hypothetical protein
MTGTINSSQFVFSATSQKKLEDLKRAEQMKRGQH